MAEDNVRRNTEQERVFKKASPNQKLVLYLSSRDLVVSPDGIDKVTGVLLVDPEFVDKKKVYGQVTLTFRYGREDEEVMGLKFCNEAIMCLAQLYPPHPEVLTRVTPLQAAGSEFIPFTLEITPLAPPSVQLVPAKEYNGSPIGTSYDVRAYVAEKIEEKLHKRSTVRMGIRVVQKAYPPPSPYLYQPGITGCAETKKRKRFFLFICKKRGKSKRRPDEFVTDPRIQASKMLCDAAQIPGPSSKRPSPMDHPSRSFELQPMSNGMKQKLPAPHCPYDEPSTSKQADTIAAAAAACSSAPACSSAAEECIAVAGCSSAMDDCCGGGVVVAECSEPSAANVRDEPGGADGNAGGVPDQAEDPQKKKRGICCSICEARRPSLAAYIAKIPAPKAVTEKYYLLSDGRVRLATSLDKAIYGHGDEIRVTISIRNNSNRTVKQIKIFVVQHVDVCMFSNGKFKNVVAMLSAKEDCPIETGMILDKTYSLLPVKSTTKNWIALEESYNKSGTSLASTVSAVANNPDDRNVFAIYVSYYVKVKLQVSLMGGELSLKLPFTLMHTCSNKDLQCETLARINKPEDSRPEENIDPTNEADPAEAEHNEQENPMVEPEKDGT